MKASRPRWRLVGAFVFAAVVVALLGMRQAAGGETRAPKPVPAEPTPTKRGAVVAATEFLSSIDLAVLLDDRRRVRVIDRFALPSARAALEKLYAAEKRRVEASYRQPPRFARAALAGYRIDEFVSTDATVSVWAASIGGSGGFPPVAGWSTTTISLTWRQDRWRVTDVRDEIGPSPDWPIQTLVTEARGFKEYRHAP
jgi:hypothetical protein